MTIDQAYPRFKITLRPDALVTKPNFVCSLCELDREHFKIAWSGAAHLLCVDCLVFSPASYGRSASYGRHLSFADTRTAIAAHVVLSAFEDEIKNGRRTRVAC